MRHPEDHSEGLQKKCKFSAWDGLIAILLQVKGMNKWSWESSLVLMSYHSHIRLKKCHLRSVLWFQPIIIFLPGAPRDVCGRIELYSRRHLNVKDVLQQPFPNLINILFSASYLMPLHIISLQLFGGPPCFPIECYLQSESPKIRCFLYDFAGLTTWVKLAGWPLPNSVLFLLCETYWVT